MQSNNQYIQQQQMQVPQQYMQQQMQVPQQYMQQQVLPQQYMQQQQAPSQKKADKPKDKFAHSKDFLHGLLEKYVKSEMSKIVENPKKAGTSSVSNPKRGNADKRNETEREDRRKIPGYSPGNQGNSLIYTNQYPVLNVIGSSIYLARHMAEKLSPSTDSIYIDSIRICLEVAFMTFSGNAEYSITPDAAFVPESLSVLKFFQQYRRLAAESEGDCSERRKKISAAFFDEFVGPNGPLDVNGNPLTTTFIGSAIKAGSDALISSITANGRTVAQYNSDSGIRANIYDITRRNYITKVANSFTEALVAFSGMCVSVPRKQWIEEKADVAFESSDKTIDCQDIGPFLRVLGTVKDEVIILPTSIRHTDTNTGVTTYGGLPINANNAHLLSYSFLTKFKLSNDIVDPSIEVIGADGKKTKHKVLTNNEAREKIVTTVSKHFDSKNGKVANAYEILERKSILDIENAVGKIKSGNGINIKKVSDNTVFPFIARNDQFTDLMYGGSNGFKAAGPDRQLDFIIYGLGYPNTKISDSTVRAIFEDLCQVFGQDMARYGALNTLPKKSSIGYQPQRVSDVKYNVTTLTSPSIQVSNQPNMMMSQAVPPQPQMMMSQAVPPQPQMMMSQAVPPQPHGQYNF